MSRTAAHHATPKLPLADCRLAPIASNAAISRLLGEQPPAAIGAAAADPDPANMFMRLFYLLEVTGQHALAMEMQAKALEKRRVYRIADPPDPAIRLLALAGPGNMIDNTPFDFVIENSDIRLDLLYFLPDATLPEIIPDHDIAIVAVAESGGNEAILDGMEQWLAQWPRPVLNRPQRIRGCAREAVYRQLHGIPGLMVPETRRLGRNAIRHMPFPLTIRPLDTHSGEGLAKVASAEELDAYFKAYGEDWFYVSEYIDCAGEDGCFRKSRIALIDGRPYICHHAISDSWIVHYRSSGMQLSDSRRAEEAAMMENFEHGFAARHRAALGAIAERLGLDYVILDCGETRDGRLLLFEADTRGWIHATDPVDVFPYKAAVMQKAFDAFRAMLTERIKRP